VTTIVPVWKELEPATSPPASSGPLVYDEADLEFVLLTQPSCAGPPETWTFADGTWTALHPAQSPPATGSMTYDAADGYVLLYTGVNCAGTVWFSQSWRFSGGTWTNITAGALPSPREGASMSYAPTLGKVVLFGGYGPDATDTTYRRVNDTWQFKAGIWYEIVTFPVPTARTQAAIAPDLAAGGVVLYGGQSSTTYCDDVWHFTGDAWVNASLGTEPGGLVGASLLPDSAIGGEILFGGEQRTGALAPAPPSNATWEWTGANWHNLTVPVAPSPRSSAGFAYDPVDGYGLLFGGQGGQTPLGDTWRFNTTTASTNTTTTPPGSTGSGPATWELLAAGAGVVVVAGVAVFDMTRRLRGGTKLPPPSDGRTPPTGRGPRSR
jgi:hypothetical protein